MGGVEKNLYSSMKKESWIFLILKMTFLCNWNLNYSVLENIFQVLTNAGKYQLFPNVNQSTVYLVQYSQAMLINSFSFGQPITDVYLLWPVYKFLKHSIYELPSMISMGKAVLKKRAIILHFICIYIISWQQIFTSQNMYILMLNI